MNSPHRIASTALLVCLLLSFVNAPAQEVVFAVRQPKGPHWYENFGHQISDPAKVSYGSRAGSARWI